VLYSGAIPTDTTQDLSFSGSETVNASVVAEWITLSEEGTHNLSISALKGDFMYTDSKTTYNGEEEAEDPVVSGVRYEEDPDTGIIISDPNENIKIDGVDFEEDLGRPENRSDLFGQWDIPVREGSVMTCSFIIDAGQDVPPVNVNTATVEELTSLHGVDTARASAIVDGRTWATVNDLSTIAGISQEMIDGWDVIV